MNKKRQTRIKKDKLRALKDKIQAKRVVKEDAAKAKTARQEMRYALAELDKIGEDDG